MFKYTFIILLGLVSCVSSVKAPESRKNLKESCVLIELRNGGWKVGSGSGSIISCNPKTSDNGGEYYEVVVLTAKHVSEFRFNEGISVHVVTYDGTDVICHQFLDNPTLDAALLVVNVTKPIPVIPLERKLPIELTPVRSYSFPIGWVLISTEGIINYDITNTIEYYWSCSAPVYPGSSGGCMVSMDDKLIGLIVAVGAKPSDSDPNEREFLPYVSLFIPSNYFFDWIMESHYVR